MNFNELWPSAFFSASSLETSAVQDGDTLKSVDICGNQFPHENWVGIYILKFHKVPLIALVI